MKWYASSSRSSWWWGSLVCGAGVV